MTGDEEIALAAKLQENFGKCPFCGSGDVNAGDHDGGRVLSLEVECDDCGGTWTEHYVFNGSSNFVRGGKAVTADFSDIDPLSDVIEDANLPDGEDDDGED